MAAYSPVLYFAFEIAAHPSINSSDPFSTRLVQPDVEGDPICVRVGHEQSLLGPRPEI